MALPKGLKTDESFLLKIAMGTTGTLKTLADLHQQGHKPIELERGSTSFKIWKAIKIKRVRVPDLLCVRCGRRIESRAKAKLAISMSHSKSDPDRAWDNGLNDTDVVALIAVEKAGDGPLDWQASQLVQYIQVDKLRSAWAAGVVVEEKPKGAGEGFEVRFTWPAAIVSENGLNATVTDVTQDRLKYTYPRRSNSGQNQTVTLRLTGRKGCDLQPLVAKGDIVQPGQIVAAVVPVDSHWPCFDGSSTQMYIGQLKSVNMSVRYAAAKALKQNNDPAVTLALTDRVWDPDEYIFVKVDAAAGLMLRGDPAGETFFRATLAGAALENRLEAVIVLSEVRTPAAISLLEQSLQDVDQDAEIRAAAAWGLGEIGSQQALPTLISSFNAVETVIKMEAARALAKIGLKAPTNVKALTQALNTSSTVERPGLAWALGKTGGFGESDFTLPSADMDLRRWIAYAFGRQNPTDYYVSEIEKLKVSDPEIYFAATLLWKISASWIDGLEVY